MSESTPLPTGCSNNGEKSRERQLVPENMKKYYQDGPDHPQDAAASGWMDCTLEEWIAGEEAYRQGYSDGVEKTTSWDVFPNVADIEAAWDARRKARENAERPVYYEDEFCEDGSPIPKEIFYAENHRATAGYARGFVHAVEFYRQGYEAFLDDDFGNVEDETEWRRRWGTICRMWKNDVDDWLETKVSNKRLYLPPRMMDDDWRDEINAPPKLLIRVDKIKLRPPNWLIRGLLERDSLALIFGDSGCGKSFVAIDWACRIATGTLWRGHEVKSAPVVYIAGEGHQGFARRIKAWELFNGVSLADKPFYRTAAIAIPDPLLVKQFIEEVTDTTGKPALIVIDTLARNFGIGDENSTQDMTRFVAACDSIRKQYDCTILIVHHTGHAEKSRARGAVALKAALDAEYRLEKKDDGHLLLTATKMKEAEEPPPLAMKLTSVELPDLFDDYREPVTSAAIEVVDADVGAIVSQARSNSRRGKWQKIGLQIAHRLMANSGDRRASISAWHEQCELLGMGKSTRYRVLDKLESQNEIHVDENWICSR